MGLWRAFRRSALAGLALSLVAVLPRTAAAASANELFGEVDGPTAAREPEVIGTYSRGCLRGAVELPATGPGWEVMRTSRNRNWGHPSLIAFVERLAAETGGPGVPASWSATWRSRAADRCASATPRTRSASTSTSG